MPKAEESGKEYVPYFKEVQNQLEMDMKEFFKHAYFILLGKEKGPKMSDFLFENKHRFIQLLKHTLHN